MFTCKLNTFAPVMNIWRIGTRYKRRLVPTEPTWEPVEESKLPPENEVSDALVNHLERLALVDFGNQEAVDRLGAAIRFANQVTAVNTEGVVPMYTVLEKESLYLRPDVVAVKGNRRAILKNAAKTEDDYFLAPPGNIPLKPRDGYKNTSGTSRGTSGEQR